MKKATYFDVEFANSKNKSICQIGLVCEDYETGDPYYPEQNIYVNPSDGFDAMCVKVHGITADKVKDKPPFPQVWADIEQYFTNTVVIGHNVATSDLDALTKNLTRHNIDIPELYYICTLDLAKKFVPSFAIENYRLGTLCAYFDIDIDSEHDAFDDACANADLFKALVETYNIDVHAHIRRYVPHAVRDFEQYVASPVIRKSISEFYGIVRGFSIDNKITDEEATYITKWRDDHRQYAGQEEINDILCAIDEILADGIVTVAETFKLQSIVKKYLDIVSTSPITLATQILNGIMEGVVADGEITTEESHHLMLWLYDNIYLSGHYPFDKVINILEDALADSVVTQEESAYITETINSILNPVESLKAMVNSVDGKHVCLSGNFAYGNGHKSDVEAYITQHGGVIDASVKKSTDILLIGACECQAYAHGTYGTKVKKALEYNQKGCNIQIMKESDFFSCVK